MKFQGFRLRPIIAAPVLDGHLIVLGIHAEATPPRKRIHYWLGMAFKLWAFWRYLQMLRIELRLFWAGGRPSVFQHSGCFRFTFQEKP